MDVKVEKDGDQLGLTIIGAIDNMTVDQLKSAFDEVYQSVPATVRLDLSGVSTINSSGIGKILMLYKNLKKENGTLEIVGISDNLLEIFQLIKLDRIIPIRK